MLSEFFILAVVTASMASAQQKLYGQCGGSGWKGPRTCVSGSTCHVQNSYYSQCLPRKGSPAPAPTKPSAPGVPAKSYRASFTEYGKGDTFGSGTCNTATSACGFYNKPGHNAAVSQNLFGVGPGAGAGPACGTCWRLTPETDSSGHALVGAHSIVVKVNNLCPAAGNPLCSQNGLTGKNQYGANVNFDTCIDDGASGALFGSSHVGLALGVATEVSCKEWSGSSNIL